MPLALARRPGKPRGEIPPPKGLSEPARRPPRPERVLPRREPRRTPLAIAGAATVLLCAALGAMVAAHANERRPFLAVARYVPMGAAIAPSDLRSVEITPAGGLSGIPASDESAVAGRHADVPLEPGELVTASVLGSGTVLGPSDALVGTSLSADQFPLGLEPGDAVLVLLGGTSANLPPTSAASRSGVGTPASSSTLARGIVVSTLAPAASSGLSGGGIVTIEVPASSAPAVAAASAAGDVSLAKVSSRTAK